MIFKDDFREAAWWKAEELAERVKDLAYLFQNSVPISQEDFIEWIVKVAGVMQGIDKFQGFVTREYFNRTSFEHLLPGTPEWLKFWDENPDKQEKMLRWREKRGV